MSSKTMNCDIDEELIKDKIGNLYRSQLEVTDFLRYNGYALNWMGLSVEKQIEYGWVKLIKS